MAAIDKLYLNDWYEFDRLVRWSICYYPKLLNYMYDWRMTYKDWDKAMNESIKSTKQIFKRELEKIGGKDVSLQDGINNLIGHYRKDADYERSYEQAKEEVEYILKKVNESDDELEADYKRPVMLTSYKVDRKLLWICPLPEVRKYLYEQCGYKKHWEWLYKLFWKGTYELTH